LRFKFHLISITESAFGRKAPKVGHVRDCDDNEAAEPSVGLVLAVIQYGSRAPPLIDRVVVGESCLLFLPSFIWCSRAPIGR
jgi:hypothetical protein